MTGRGGGGGEGGGGVSVAEVLENGRKGADDMGNPSVSPRNPEKRPERPSAKAKIRRCELKEKRSLEEETGMSVRDHGRCSPLFLLVFSSPLSGQADGRS